MPETAMAVVMTAYVMAVFVMTVSVKTVFMTVGITAVGEATFPALRYFPDHHECKHDKKSGK